MSNKKAIINAEELASISENNDSDDNLVIAARNLLEAINDWPSAVSEPEEFLLTLNREIGKPLSKENIESYLSSLSVVKSAWKMEAIASVLSMFNHDEATTLDEIITNLSDQFRSSNAK